MTKILNKRQKTSSSPVSAVSKRCSDFLGVARIPGDKSISHRALILGALAVGETTISGLLESEDVMSTVAALQVLGVEVLRIKDRQDNAFWRLRGRGLAGLCAPDDVIDMGNSGTATRLLTGILAAHPFISTITGDSSLRSRPMGRVVDPLQRMGASFKTRAGKRLPLTITGTDNLCPIRYSNPVPSAQVKSAVLLAGLHAPGKTSVIETEPTRDHTERLLPQFGAEVVVEQSDSGVGGEIVSVAGQMELRGANVDVPGDPSSAAFLIVAGLLVEGSKISLPGISVNPRRSGLIETLQDMGANISFSNQREAGGEPFADIEVRSGSLKGCHVPADRAPSMIDEYPILAIAAACADGDTIMEGLAELRVKESDRLSAIQSGLSACGAGVTIEGDNLVVRGTGRPPMGGGVIATQMDHRIAMSFLVMGAVTEASIEVDDISSIATSYPNFIETMNELGACISVRNQVGSGKTV